VAHQPETADALVIAHKFFLPRTLAPHSRSTALRGLRAFGAVRCYANSREWVKKNSCKFVKFAAQNLLNGQTPRCG